MAIQDARHGVESPDDASINVIEEKNKLQDNTEDLIPSPPYEPDYPDGGLRAWLIVFGVSLEPLRCRFSCL